MANKVTKSIINLANKIAGQNKTPANGTTKAALDVLLDTISGEDVDTKGMDMPTIIDTITANYSGGGGGGGGVDVGALAFVGGTDTAPTVGEERFSWPIIALAKIGDVAIYDGSPYGDGVTAGGGFAAGLTLTTDVVPAASSDTMGAYVCTVDGSEQYATVAPWGGTLTREDAVLEGNPAYKWTFTMPELQEGELLIFYPHLAD